MLTTPTKLYAGQKRNSHAHTYTRCTDTEFRISRKSAELFLCCGNEFEEHRKSVREGITAGCVVNFKFETNLPFELIPKLLLALTSLPTLWLSSPMCLLVERQAIKLPPPIAISFESRVVLLVIKKDEGRKGERLFSTTAVCRPVVCHSGRLVGDCSTTSSAENIANYSSWRKANTALIAARRGRGRR